MSDNNIPKPKRTYKKRAPKAAPKVSEDPPQPAVEKISHDDNSVEKVSFPLGWVHPSLETTGSNSFGKWFIWSKTIVVSRCYISLIEYVIDV
mgnify:CR=1 FL=1